MTTPSSPDEGVHLQDTRQEEAKFAVLAGLAWLVLIPMIASCLARREWSGLLFGGVPVAILAIARCYSYFTLDDYIVLYSGRIEYPRRRGKPRIVTWTDVTTVRWPATRDSSARIEIFLPRSTDWPLARAWLDLDHVSPAGRLTLIRYLRAAVAGVEQEGWYRFCRHRAVPLIETLQCAERGDSSQISESPLVAAARWLSVVIARRPFVGGLLSPLFVLVLLPRFLPRSLWWAMATAIAISGAVNIRMVWGWWASPFTEMAVGFSAVLFFLGLLAPADRTSQKSPDEISSLGVFGSLAVAIFGFPFLGNAMALGWVHVPRDVAGSLGLVFFLVLLSPAFIAAARKKRRGKQETALLEADAIHRWDVYVQTGVLPAPAPEAPPCQDGAGR